MASVLRVDATLSWPASGSTTVRAGSASCSASAEAVLAVEPALPKDGRRHDQHRPGGPYPAGSECAFEVRAIFSDDRGSIVEDPVTGSLNASLGQWLVGSGRVVAPYVASQGTLLGRPGGAHQPGQDGAIWVAGDTSRWWRASSSLG